MSKQTAQGSPDGPKYIYGKENVNWSGPKQAAEHTTDGSASAARGDFTTAQEKKPIDEMKEATDRVSDIDFPLYSDIDITDPRYQIDDQAIAFEYVEDDGETVVFMQQREFDPQNDMMSYIYTDLSITDDGLEEENMLEKYYDGDEERFEEEFVNPLTDVYVDSLVRYFNNDDDLSLHVNYMQSDYIISYLAHEEDADSDTTVQKSWDIINDAVYDIREQERIPREIDERLRQAKRMLLDGTFNELYTDGEYQYATDPDTVEAFPDTLGEYLKKQQ